MGLYDRDYMREEESGHYRPRRPAAPWSPTIALLIVLSAIFIVQVAAGPRGSRWIDIEFGLSLAGVLSGRVWQLFTFQFLHGSIMHILLNGVTLYSFGRFLEQQLGRNRFLLLYFISGTVGGFFQILATWILGQNPYVPAVGASAGIAGLLGAFMLAYPNLQLIIFPIPFKIRAWTMLWVVLPVTIIGTIHPFGGIAHAAHLGGLLTGGVFVRWMWKARRQPAAPPFLSTPPRSSSAAAPEPPQDDFIRNEVDPILEKIATHGIHSLSDRERRVLEEARKRMGQR